LLFFYSRISLCIVWARVSLSALHLLFSQNAPRATSNICWHNCQSVSFPPRSLSLPHLPCNSINLIYIFFSRCPGRLLLRFSWVFLFADLCNVCQGAQTSRKTSKRSWRFFKNLGQCSLFISVCAHLTVFSADFSCSWTWPCNVAVLCIFFDLFAIHKLPLQWQKLVIVAVVSCCRVDSLNTRAFGPKLARLANAKR